MTYHEEYNKWREQFKKNIKSLNIREALYIVNTELFYSNNKSGNFNSKILINNSQLDEEKDFVIIDKTLWSKIKKDHPNETEIKFEGIYQDKKYNLIINNFIFYFYYVNEKNHLIEGYYRFELPNQASEIFTKFMASDFNDFINNYGININSNSLQIINKNDVTFFFRIKPGIKKKNDIINNNQFNNFGNIKINANINNNINGANINNNINGANININGANINNDINRANINNNINRANINNIPKNNNRLLSPNENHNNNNFINKGMLRNRDNRFNMNNNININNAKKFNPMQINLQLNFQNNNLINNFRPMNINNNKRNIRRPQSAGKIRSNNQVIIPRIFVVGLNNVGATCYMNATLQCLVHVKKLTQFLLNPEQMQMIQGNKNKYKLTDAYLNVLINSWLNVNINNYSPNYFKQVISDMNPLFQGIQANDSKDLIIFLMEKMHNELNIPLNNPNLQQNNVVINQYDFNQSFKSFKKYFINNYRSVISDLFYGFFDSIMNCKNCGAESHNIQCYNILIFPLEEVRIFKNRPQNVVSIEECFQYYEKQDIMTGANQIYCNKCRQNSDSKNYSKLIACPNILIINFNRGKGLQFNIKIEFEEILDVKNFLKKSDDIPSEYKLFGIVTHFGPSSMAGHFIAFCKSFVDGNWYKCNDSMVTPSSFHEAKNTGVPYILFYSGTKK